MSQIVAQMEGQSDEWMDCQCQDSIHPSKSVRVITVKVGH